MDSSITLTSLKPHITSTHINRSHLVLYGKGLDINALEGIGEGHGIRGLIPGMNNINENFEMTTRRHLSNYPTVTSSRSALPCLEGSVINGAQVDVRGLVRWHVKWPTGHSGSRRKCSRAGQGGSAAGRVKEGAAGRVKEGAAGLVMPSGLSLQITVS